MTAGVVPQSSCSLNPDAPDRSCSHIASAEVVLPLASRAMLIGQWSNASSMRSRYQAPVTVVALVPSAGPVPPPTIVVMPDPSASSSC